MTKRNKLDNGENVNLGYNISSMKRISITENNEAQRYHSNASSWRYWKLDYAVANDVNQAKFEKLNYKKKEWYEPSKFEKSPH